MHWAASLLFALPSHLARSDSAEGADAAEEDTVAAAGGCPDIVSTAVVFPYMRVHTKGPLCSTIGRSAEASINYAQLTQRLLGRRPIRLYRL
eukprot:COSAG01_NODE_8606_length_2721_cov_8.662853_5_plen_92_part_00